jgi:NADH dehydrogenase
MERPHVVILGGGFGGLYCARALRHAQVRVTVLDRQNHHLFQPLLYQVATASLNPSEIAAPIRYLLRDQDNVTVLLAEATGIDTAARRVELVDGYLAYDYLVVATGATHSYFGNDAWADRAPGLKTLEDAVEIRQRFLLAFEAAERETDPERRRAALTFVVIGAGPTGVEMAGSIAEIAHRAMRDDFRNIDPGTARVILVEGVDRVLPAYHPDLSARARKHLEDLGVEVRTGVRVTAMDDDTVTLGGETVAARTVVWAAGVAGSPLARSLGVPLDRVGRVLVCDNLSIPGHPEVFVVGDLAALTQDGQAVPGVAQAAIQGGQHAADQIVRAIHREGTTPFRYNDKGSMATIGRNKAVVESGTTRVWGFAAWLMWAFIHVLFLIGFRNRLFVMLSWAWSYFTFHRGVRLITRRVPPTLLGPEDDPSLVPPPPAPPS